MDEEAVVRSASVALITIDTQRDTLDGGPLEIAGTSAVLPNIAALCQAFRDARRPIIHVVRLYLADGSNAEPCRQALVRGPTAVLRPGTPGRSLGPGLLPPDGPELDDDLLLGGGVQELGNNEVAIYKPRWGAFFQTPLESYLQGLGVDSLLFAGCNFPNCPRTSIYEASERDLHVAIAEDALSGLYARGRDEMRDIGVGVLRTATLVDMLQRNLDEHARKGTGSTDLPV